MPASSSTVDSQPGGGVPSPTGAPPRSLRTALRALAADPSAVPALGALALFVAWAADQAGFPQTHWAPGGLILLALLAIAIGAAGLRLTSIPRPVQIAIGALGAYTAYSFLSILWAKVPADAWEGADRTLVYLAAFALFAGFRRTGVTAALLLGAWTMAMAGLAAFTVLHIDAAAGSTAHLQSLMPGGRLTFPAGYTNANAALWMTAFFPAWLLAAARSLPPLLRGLLAGGAVVLASAALYSQSRGSVYSLPIVLLLIFALLPGRARNLVWLVPIGVGVGVCTPAILRLDKHLELGWAPASMVRSATLPVLLAAVVVSVLTTVLAIVESRWPGKPRARDLARRGVAILGVMGVLAAVAAGVAVAGKPVGRVEHAWNTFTSIKGYAANSSDQSRLTGGFGSNRYDFYRVAWHEFLAHPLLGIGADNFAEGYLRRGRSLETPHYPHSVELRTLAETGLIGALLALAGLLAGLAAVRGALRLPEPLAKAVAGAAVAGFAYWAIHGSFDWFFEYAGLGAPAFALLGLSCSLAPRTPARRTPARQTPAPHPASGAQSSVTSRDGSKRRLGLGWIVPAVACAAIVVVAAISLAAPWLSRMEVQSAAQVWTRSPASAYARLRQAADLNPLSAEPDLIAATIALRLRQLERARQQFERALDRVPGNAYATLELGALASSRGDGTEARRLLRRAVRLNPRSGLARQALATAVGGGRVNIADLNRSILREAQQIS
jgi:tetratricopeptide (TPR) repeat protein